MSNRMNVGIPVLPYSSCPECNFITADISASMSKPCPHCGVKGLTREIYPDFGAYYLYQTIFYHYSILEQRTNDSHEELVKRVQDVTGSQYPEQLLLDVAKQIHQIYIKHPFEKRGSVDVYQEICQAISDRLSIGISCTQNGQMLGVLFGYNDAFEEGATILILCDSLLESLFNTFIISVVECIQNRHMKESERKVIYREDFKIKSDRFYTVTGKTLHSAVKATSSTNFYKDCQKVIDLRNTFIHQFACPIGKKHVDTAFNVAQEAVGVFVKMNNTYCVKPLQKFVQQSLSEANVEAKIDE